MVDEKDEKKKGRERRLECVKDWQEKLKNQYKDLTTKRVQAIKYRDADPSILAVLEGRSKITTTDMQDAIDMAKPDILEQIAGIDEPLKLDPDNGTFVEAVKKLEVLGNVMVKRKNKWFRIWSDFLDDSMTLQFGCIKYRWIEEVKTTEKVYEGLEEVELQSLLQKEGAKLSEDIPAAGIDEGQAPSAQMKPRITKIKYSMTDEYVRLDGVPAERIRFPLNTRDFAETPIVIEEILLYEHEFIRDYGKDHFKKIKEAKEALAKSKPDPVYEARFKHVGGLYHIYNKDTDQYKAYECYFWEGDKAWVLTYAALDVVMTDEENKYGKPPYRGGSPFLVAHALIGKGYYDCLKNTQEERTHLKRSIWDVVTQNNYRRYFVDVEGCGMNIDDYENNSAMNALIRCTAPPSQFIMPEKKVPLSADVLQYWEIMNVEKDNHIPTQRSFSGVDGGRDERTYRGKQLKVNQSAKKLLMMMRGYAEEVAGPLFQDILDCIAKFMKKKTVVRYLNEDYDISPEDIICKYALIVNVGLGTHDKQDLIVKLQQLIGLAMKQMETGIVTPQNLFYMNQELVKAMGFLNTMDFVTDPKLKETIMQFIHLVMTTMNHFMELHQNEPEMQQMAQMMVKMIHQVMAALGIKEPEDKGGQNAKGTQSGEKPAEIPQQPANGIEPQTEVTGGGFFA